MLWLGTAEPTIKFSSEAVTGKIQTDLGLAERIRKFVRSPPLNYNIASLPRERPLINSRSLTKVT